MKTSVGVAFAAGMSIIVLGTSEIGVIDSRYGMVEHGKGEDAYWTASSLRLPDRDQSGQYRVLVKRQGVVTAIFLRAHEMVYNETRQVA